MCHFMCVTEVRLRLAMHTNAWVAVQGVVEQRRKVNAKMDTLPPTSGPSPALKSPPASAAVRSQHVALNDRPVVHAYVDVHVYITCIYVLAHHSICSVTCYICICMCLDVQKILQCSYNSCQEHQLKSINLCSDKAFTATLHATLRCFHCVQTIHLSVHVQVKSALTGENKEEEKKKEKKAVELSADGQDDWRIRPHAPMRRAAYHAFPLGEIEPWKPEDDDPPVPRQTPNVSTLAM